MSVATYTQPDSTAQFGSAYKANLDGAPKVMSRVAAAFAPHAQSTPDMTVRVDAGHVFGHNSSALTEVAAQSTGTITAPAANPRKDIVYIDQLTGSVGVATGTEAASPSDPAVPAGKLPIARVTLATSTTSITNSLLDDIRDLAGLGLSAFASQAEAEGGSENTKYMTPLRTAQAISALVAGALKNFALYGDISPSQITADQNDYSPTGLADAAVLRLSSDASRNITGLAGGADGRIIVIHNVGAQNITLKDESASSSAANRFALAADVTLAADQTATLQYDATSSRWRVISTVSGGGGKLKQVVVADSDTQTITNSGSWVASSLSCSITPTSATSSILVLVISNMTTADSGGWYQEASARIYRDINGGGYSGIGQEFGQISRTGGWVLGASFVMATLDSPATTQVCTYKPYVKADGAGGGIFFNYTIATGVGGTIVLIEIGA